MFLEKLLYLFHDLYALNMPFYHVFFYLIERNTILCVIIQWKIIKKQ